MGKRGPKPINVETLKGTAQAWANNLFEMRYGRPGLLYQAEYEPVQVGKGVGLRSVRVIQAYFIPVGSGIAKLPAELKDHGWVTGKQTPRSMLRKVQHGGIWWNLIPDAVPKPQLWENLKEAQSKHAMRKALRALRHCAPSDQSVELVTGLEKLRDLMQARALPSYPKAPNRKRPRSDDKRIGFFAKVMAGLELGIAPATSIKRLARVHFPRRQESEVWATMNAKPYKEFVLSEQGKITPIPAGGD